MNCNIGSENETIQEVKSIEGVARASRLSGVYDLIADLRADSDNDIAKIVRGFGLIKGIRSLLTMYVSENSESLGESI